MDQTENSQQDCRFLNQLYATQRIPPEAISKDTDRLKVKGRGETRHADTRAHTHGAVEVRVISEKSRIQNKDYYQEQKETSHNDKIVNSSRRHKNPKWKYIHK